MIGNSVGGGEAELAVKYYRLTRVVALVVVVSIALLLLLEPEPIISLFTKESEVASLALSVIPIVSIKYIWDGMQGYG